MKPLTATIILHTGRTELVQIGQNDLVRRFNVEEVADFNEVIDDMVQSHLEAQKI